MIASCTGIRTLGVGGNVFISIAIVVKSKDCAPACSVESVLDAASAALASILLLAGALLTLPAAAASLLFSERAEETDAFSLVVSMGRLCAESAKMAAAKVNVSSRLVRMGEGYIRNRNLVRSKLLLGPVEKNEWFIRKSTYFIYHFAISVVCGFSFFSLFFFLQCIRSCSEPPLLRHLVFSCFRRGENHSVWYELKRTLYLGCVAFGKENRSALAIDVYVNNNNCSEIKQPPSCSSSSSSSSVLSRKLQQQQKHKKKHKRKPIMFTITSINHHV
ncbi:hypothetical protein BDB00DRAFT_210039 [Zychaea mexicana]|uniref:uncharacterized protein n=1 Tax=Zychaea mexicana TaxID=64656 RepID=UPI0022FE65EE|nr:uncharacterized protein BDB00DRAFT_210039 [Zychaea mexicana]KAI9495675.1 hypothetical protein BDB00DRAFT_210039 [Zychaea mexicana]